MIGTPKEQLALAFDDDQQQQVHCATDAHRKSSDEDENVSKLVAELLLGSPGEGFNPMGRMFPDKVACRPSNLRI